MEESRGRERPRGESAVALGFGRPPCEEQRLERIRLVSQIFPKGPNIISGCFDLFGKEDISWPDFFSQNNHVSFEISLQGIYCLSGFAI